MYLKRILMNAADETGGSGNGAAPVAPPASESVPQAQGDHVTLSKADLDAMIASGAAKAVADVKDSIYAEARRTFSESKKSKPPAETPSATAPSPAPDATRLRALDRALAKSGHAERLSETQYKRIERLFAEESPDDASVWVNDYFDGLGVKHQPVTQPQAAHTAKPVADHPVSNRGAPPPAQVPIDELDLFTASDSDRAAYIKAKGPKAYVAQLQKQAKGRPVRLG